MTDKSNIDLETSLIARIIQTIDPDAAAIVSEDGSKILVSHGMGEDEGEPKWHVVERVVESGGPSSETNLEHSILAVPYKDGQGQTKGIMYIELQAPRKIRHRDLAILQELRRRAEKIYGHFVESNSSEEGLERLSKARRSAVSTLNVISRILKPERGAIFVQIGGEPRALAAHGIQNDSLEAASISAPLLEHLWKSDGPQLIVDAKNELDPEQFEDVVDYQIRSVASCPLKGEDGVTRGLIYLDHRDDADYFQGPQLAILKRFADTFRSDISWLLDGGPNQGLASDEPEIDSPSAWLSEESTPKGPVARKDSSLPPFARRKRRAEVTSAPPQVSLEEDDPGALFPEPADETTELSLGQEEQEFEHDSDVITVDYPDEEQDQASEPTMEDDVLAVVEQVDEEELRGYSPEATMELSPDKADALRRLIQEGSDFELEDSGEPVLEQEAREDSSEEELVELLLLDPDEAEPPSEEQEAESLELLRAPVEEEPASDESSDEAHDDEPEGLTLVRAPALELEEPELFETEDPSEDLEPPKMPTQELESVEVEQEEESLELLQGYEAEAESLEQEPEEVQDDAEIELLDDSDDGDDVFESDSIIDRDELEIQHPEESGEQEDAVEPASESLEQEEPAPESLEEEEAASESLEDEEAEESASESLEDEEAEEPAAGSLEEEEAEEPASESLEEDAEESAPESLEDEEAEESASESLEEEEAEESASESLEDEEAEESAAESLEVEEAEEPASESLEEEEAEESASESLEQEEAVEPASERSEQEGDEEPVSESLEEEDGDSEEESLEPIGPLGENFLTGLEEDKLEFLRVQPLNFEEPVPVEYEDESESEDVSASGEEPEPEAESSEQEDESADVEQEVPEETVEYFEPPVTEFAEVERDEPSPTLQLSAESVLAATAATAVAATVVPEVAEEAASKSLEQEPVEESLEAPPETSSYPQSTTALTTTDSHVITATEHDQPEISFWQRLWAKIWPWAKLPAANKKALQALSISGNIYFDQAPSDEAPTEITIIFPAKKMKVVIELAPDETSYDCHLRFEEEIPPRFSLAIQRFGYFPVKFSTVNVLEDEDDGFHAMVSEITLIPRDEDF